uniref:putative transmembrane protein 244 isoform X2 n=1 Tax=Myxine glutinosa TaxID=7769 RepID=UPI00358FF100
MPMDGIVVNGIVVNGIMVNGIVVNGIVVNGIATNSFWESDPSHNLPNPYPCKSFSPRHACLVSTDVTCFICGILFTSFVKHWIWDYATSTIIIHIIVTSAVMRAFPLVWQWWTVLGSGLALMVVTGQLLAALVYTTGTEKLEIT